MYTKPQFTVGVFGMIFDEQGRILLCHRTDVDLWNLPGGSMEHGEAPWDGAKREVKEETGLDVEVSKLVSICSRPDQNDIVFSFLCRVIDGEITLNEEADHIEYFALDAFPPNTSPKLIERILEASKDPKDLILRVQTGKSSLELMQEGKL